MEILSKPVRLSPDMARLFNSLRAGAEPYSVYQQPAETADEQVCRVAESLLSDAGIDFTTRNAYMWYVRELAKLLRTRHGWDLAFHLEMVMRKWLMFGLESNTMQLLVCEIHHKLAPRDGKDEGQSTKDEASQKDEVRSPNDESNPKSEVQSPASSVQPNDEASPQAGKDEGQRPKDKAEGKAEFETRCPDGEERTANSVADSADSHDDYWLAFGGC